MALDTVATHLADLGETRTRTDLYGAQADLTRTKDFEAQATLPGKLAKGKVDLDTAKLIYSNLLADETYNDLVRKNNINSIEAALAYTESRGGPKGVAEDMILEQQVKEAKGNVQKVYAENDMILNKFTPVYNMAEEHFNNPTVQGQNMLEAAYEQFIGEMVELNIAEQGPAFDQATGQGVTGPDGQPVNIMRVAMLPGGKFQNDPLTIANFPSLQEHMEGFKSLAQKSGAYWQQELIQESQTERERIKAEATGAPDTYSPTELSAIVKDVDRRIMGAYPQALMVDDDGKVTDKKGYEHGNTLIRDYVTGVIDQSKVDPRLKDTPQTAITDAAMQNVRESVQTHEGRYDPSGLGDWSYNTYIPTKQSAERMGTTQAEYISKLEAMIEQYAKARDSAQSIADEILNQNFTNMVTTTPGQ